MPLSNSAESVGSLLSAAADSSPSFVSGRAIAGTGAAGITSGAMRIISIASPREHRPFLEAVGALLMGEICFDYTKV